MVILITKEELRGVVQRVHLITMTLKTKLMRIEGQFVLCSAINAMQFV